MRAQDFINEAYTDPEISQVLKEKGYKELGSGVDQTAYLAPDGTILKIFGTSMYNDGSMELTQGQKTFKAFADYCLAHSNNPFLPQFSGWETFEYKGRPYLQIKVERLFEFPNQQWAEVLANIADAAEDSNSPKAKERFINNEIEWGDGDDPESELFVHLGDDGFNLLWDTIYDLGRIAKKIGLRGLDLHSGNFMIAHDGQIVISDPFYSGD